MTYYKAGWFNEGDVPAGNSTDFIARDRFASFQTAAAAVVNAYRAEGRAGIADALFNAQQQTLAALTSGDQGGTCARVKIRLEQEAVITRDAFRATLELDNNGSSRLENVRVTVNIRPESGGADTNLFAVRFDGATVLSGVDARHPRRNSTGTAKWLIIPTVDAAPQAATQFPRRRHLELPAGWQRRDGEHDSGAHHGTAQPATHTEYFHQRDVFSDDPFTDMIEPAIPYSLAVMVQNRGYGEANNFRITSAQPKIIENDKGLLIDFYIIATEVAGQWVSPSLTVNFGNIHAGDRR